MSHPEHEHETELISSVVAYEAMRSSSNGAKKTPPAPPPTTLKGSGNSSSSAAAKEQPSFPVVSMKNDESESEEINIAAGNSRHNVIDEKDVILPENKNQKQDSDALASSSYSSSCSPTGPVDKFDVSINSRSACIALVFYVLAAISFAVVGGIHAANPHAAGWSPALYSMPVVLIVAAVVFTQGCSWRTMTVDRAARLITVNELSVVLTVLPWCSSLTISFDDVNGVAVESSDAPALAQTQITKDAIQLCYFGPYGDADRRALLLETSVPYESKRRAAGWIVYLTNAGIAHVEFRRSAN